MPIPQELTGIYIFNCTPSSSLLPLSQLLSSNCNCRFLWLQLRAACVAESLENARVCGSMNANFGCLLDVHRFTEKSKMFAYANYLANKHRLAHKITKFVYANKHTPHEFLMSERRFNGEAERFARIFQSDGVVFSRLVPCFERD